MSDTARMRTLGELLAGLADDAALRDHAQRPVTGICADSRHAQPGQVFVALRGSSTDGRRYISDAVARGVSAIVLEAGPGLEGAAAVIPAAEASDAAPGPVWIPVGDARGALARLASRWHGLEGSPLLLAGVTGTNGKSTTAFMLAGIFRAAGWPCGLLGTVQYDLCGRTVSAEMTTPGPLELCAYLTECAARGARAAVLEVSSHALDQKRTDGLSFRAAAFTNLTGDHLDYHHTLAEYAAAKARLFSGLAPDAWAVVNADDPAHAEMLRACRARVLRCSLLGPAEISATLSGTTVAGTQYRMKLAGRELVLENALVGRHNVYNALLAAGLAHGLGVPTEAIAEGLTSLRNVPGRLQRVANRLGVEVFVDYAHTDDALRNVLSVLRPLARRRLICVFGCGGNRDRTKRPRMARAAAELAHAVIVTSDNPRDEDPREIIAEILAGFDADARRRVVVEVDRAAAIRLALAGAAEGDVVLIAGKGHENYQLIGSERIHFDDVEVAQRAASELAPLPC